MHNWQIASFLGRYVIQYQTQMENLEDRENMVEISLQTQFLFQVYTFPLDLNDTFWWPCYILEVQRKNLNY